MNIWKVDWLAVVGQQYMWPMLNYVEYRALDDLSGFAIKLD